MSHLHKPDISQECVIAAKGTALRIVAPAGSGKTETLVRRVIERTGPGGCDPRRILMLTFDNNGQHAFKRLLRRLAPRPDQPKFQTFNTFGKGILQTYFSDEISQIVRDQELLPFRREIGPLPILAWDERPRDLIETFRAMKDQGWRPIAEDRKEAVKWLRVKYLELPLRGDDLDWGAASGGTGHRTRATRDDDAQLNRLYDAYLQYEEELRRRGRMDYQDQKLRPLTRLMCAQRIREQERQRYDEVIVDEAQDISRLDALLLWCVIGDQTTITLAGDDDQTIYEFKQSSSVFLRDAARYFERDFETFQLDRNYRSPDAILDPAQRLIAHNIERIEKSVKSARADPGEVIVQASTNNRERIERVAQWIAQLRNEHLAWHEIGLLAPKSAQLKVFADALARHGIPTKLNTGKNDDGTVIDAVELSTVHKAKGRQWRVVVLPLSGEGEMPGTQEVRQGKLEAERRAYYVSMSRAADMLCVAYVLDGEHDTIRRSASGEIVGTSGASRFLFEAGLVREWEESAPQLDESTDLSQPAPPEMIVVSPESPTVFERLQQRDAERRQRIGRIDPSPAEPVALEVEKTPAPAAVQDAPPVPRKPTRAERKANQSRLLTASTLKLIDQAERHLADEDYRYALFDAWEPVFQMLKRLDNGRTGHRSDAYEIINTLSIRKVLDPEWIDRLHRWRKARNAGLKESRYRHADIRDLVLGLRPFLGLAGNILEGGAPATVTPVPAQDRAPAAPSGTGVRSATPPATNGAAPIVPPRKTVARAVPLQPRKLHPVPTENVMRVVNFLARGGINPDTHQPIRSITFHTVNDGIEFLPLQLGLILNDIRFLVRSEYRYTTSPMFARFCHRLVPYVMPVELGQTYHRTVSQPLHVFESRIQELLDEVLAAYCDDLGYKAPNNVLLARLQDAEALHNGAEARGIQLIPNTTL